jgi:HEAT repeat protein
MRLAIALLLVAGHAAAQGIPPASRIDAYASKKNQQRLRIEWDALPDATPVKLPDGTDEPAKAPWPFVLFVQSEDGKSAEKIASNILTDARFALASRLVKPIKVTPTKAVDLRYLAGISGIKDPTIVVLGRDFSVVGALRDHKEFTADRCLALMAKAADAAYSRPLGAWLKEYVGILQEAEKLWKEELRIEEMAERSGGKSAADREKGFKEIEAREREFKAQEERLLDREEALVASMQLRADETVPLPTTTGAGKSKRALTPQELEALAAFRRFARDKNPIVRAAAVEDLGAVDSAPIVEQILQAANDVDARVIRAAGKALSKMRSEEALAAMTAALASGKPGAKQAVLLGFAEGAPHAPAVAGIVALVDAGDDDLRAAAVQALARQRDPSAVPPLVRTLSGGAAPALRVLAAAALGELKAKEAVPALVQSLTASDWSLKKVAAEALGKIRAKESIPPLLDRFENEEGLMLEVLHGALVSITGQDFKYSTANWRKWWDKFGGSFAVPTEKEIEEAKRLAEKALEGYAKPDKRKYHKIETLSRKMVFIIDVSSSMADKIVIPADAPPSAAEEYPDRVKMEIAKRELIDILSTLDKNVWFNVITFAGRVKMWQDNLVPGSMRTAAIKFVADLKPIPQATRKSGGDEQKTNTYAALAAAFDQSDAAVPNWKSRTQVDTIFLVTDGCPTAGEIVEVPKLIDTVCEWNRTRGIVIHVICFDKQDGQRLAPLALRNGGKYVLRGF